MKKLKRRVNSLVPAFTGKLFRQYAFWFCFFAITRLIFLLYNREELIGLHLSDILPVFRESLYVDFSMAAYFMLISVFLSGLASLFAANWISVVSDRFQQVLVILVSAITIAELSIYDEWGHKLTFKALWFLQNPGEVYRTASASQFWGGLLAITILAFVGIILYRYITKGSSDYSIQSPAIKILALFLWLSFSVIAMRGGFNPIPIQISDAYFSRHNILNAASANSSFNLASNIIHNLKARKPYEFMSSNEASEIVNAIYQVEKDTTISFLKTDHPNIILFVLEGWSSDVVASLGGYEGIAPAFSQLIREGISFDSCYASGNLSDQGMGAVFSAFPAQPRTSIVTQPEKYTHLPCINKTFLNMGYYTSYMFGGQLSYGNIKSYMYFNQFHKIIEEKDFDSRIYRGRLGVHDGDLFNRQLEELQNVKAPFFAAMFTLSTHSPYDFQGGRPLNWGDKEKDYINSVHYADSCLNQFMQKARNEPWYNNTLFIFVSDHHHNTPRGYSYYHPEYRRIPLVFYGDVIKEEFRGMQDNRICSQLDLASTLLHQLKQPANEFVWSKNLFNPYCPQFAFYTFDEGFGWIKPEGHLVWYADGRKEAERYSNNSVKDRLFIEGQAYLQKVTETFWNY